MTVQRVRWITAVATLLLAALHGEARAQMGPGQMFHYSSPPVASVAAAPPGYAPVSYSGLAPYDAAPDAHFAHGPLYDNGMSAYPGAGFPMGEPPCPHDVHGGGFGHHGHHRHRGGRLGQGLSSILSMLAPYGEGGCCAPRWFDIQMEAVFMNLDNRGPSIVFSRDTATNERITSADLDHGVEPGMRFSAAYQTGPGSNLEFTYLGLFEYEEVARATGPGNLLSVFSDFTALNPPFGIQQFDLANLHEARLGNEFHSFELNYRRRWRGSTCLVQGSWLAGVRYLRLKEHLRFFADVERDSTGDGFIDTDAQGFYNLDTRNHLTGFQIGGDVWFCLLPGLNVGFDGRTGIYGNAARQMTNISGVDFVTGFESEFIPPERISGDRASFISEFGLLVTYRLNPNFTVRGGYQILYVDRVALALENFNPDLPQLTTRTPLLNDRGSLLYDGFSIGAEWMW